MGWFSKEDAKEKVVLRNKDGYTTKEMQNLMGFEGYVTDNESGFLAMNMFYTLHKRILELENKVEELNEN